jgi:hypothetical protein
MSTPESGRCRNLQMPSGTDAAQAHRALGIGQFAQDALALLEEGRTLESQRYPARRAQQQFRPKAFLQGIEPAPDDGRRNPFDSGSRGQTAATCDINESRYLLELIHYILLVTNNLITS